MTPSLHPGDYLITVINRRPRAGQIVVFRHPKRDGFWLVKRVSEVKSDHMTVLSDASHLTVADSRSFGSVPVDGSYRLVFRYRRGRRD